MASRKSALDAAIEVLEEEGGPLHYKEITKRMLEKDLWQSKAKTPESTVSQALNGEISERRGGARVVRVGRGIFEMNPRQGVHQGPNENTMTFADAAERVLSDSTDQQSLHYGEITELALQRGLIYTESFSPESTMYGSILTENKRRNERGESPRFVRTSPGMFGLVAWKSEESGVLKDIERIIRTNNEEVRQSLLDRARALEPSAFEELVAELLVAMGFEDVNVTARSRDGGIDVRGTLVMEGIASVGMAVQAKRWQNNVGAPVVQQVRGSRREQEQCMIIRTSDFTRDARSEATGQDRTPVALVNGELLANLLLKHRVGVSVRRYELYTLSEGDDAGSSVGQGRML